jgi:uncharacterized protein (DUF58 family)
MPEKQKLNTDIPGRISELAAMMKEFLLKYKLYRILLRGKGLEFETYRTFAPDDDASSIDWKASRRSNSLLVKQYRDEKNLKIMFILDVSDNMVFGSQEKLKCEYAAEVVASFAHLINTTGDKTGSILFSDEIKSYRGPKGGERNFHRFVDDLVNPNMYGGKQNLDTGFDFLLNFLGRNIDSVVIISDFISFSDKHKKNLTLIGSKYETLVIAVRDPLDITMPDFAGEIVLKDPDTDQQLLIDPRIAKIAYEHIAAEKRKILKEVCQVNSIDIIELSTKDPFVPALAEFLKARIKRKERR